MLTKSTELFQRGINLICAGGQFQKNTETGTYIKQVSNNPEELWHNC